MIRFSIAFYRLQFTWIFLQIIEINTQIVQGVIPLDCTFQQTRFPFTIVNGNSPNIPWMEISNTTTACGSYQWLCAGYDQESSSPLITYNYGFNLDQNAIIAKIETVHLRKNLKGSGIQDIDSTLLKKGIPIEANDAMSDYWGPQWQTVTIPSDQEDPLWGENWTSTDINDSQFGTMLQVGFNGDNESIQIGIVGCISIKVYYYFDCFQLSNCHGNGICNASFQCECFTGFSSPDCIPDPPPGLPDSAYIAIGISMLVGSILTGMGVALCVIRKCKSITFIHDDDDKTVSQIELNQPTPKKRFSWQVVKKSTDWVT